MIQRNVDLGEVSLKIMSGQDFANVGQTEGVTDRPTDRQTDRGTTCPKHNTTEGPFKHIK